VACVAVRPEQLQIGFGPDGAEATVMLAEHLGDHSIVHLRVEGLPELLRARIDAPGVDVTTGAAVRLVTGAAKPLAFEAEGRRLEG
jgi:multiple sugar transport system ATP-binding protein